MRALIDLAECKRDVRLRLAALDGDRLIEEQLGVAQDLAEHLARREGRDAGATGDAMLEASVCLLGLAKELDCLGDPGVVVMLNVLGFAGITLADSAEDRS